MFQAMLVSSPPTIKGVVAPSGTVFFQGLGRSAPGADLVAAPEPQNLTIMSPCLGSPPKLFDV